MAEDANQLVIGEPCDPAKAEPLRVVARLAEAITVGEPIMLDGLLAWVEANQERRIPPMRGERPAARIEIPIARTEDGAFHLCSQAHGASIASELRHYHWRAPVQEMARMGNGAIRRVDTTGGANKGLRIPYRLELVPELEWWCVGDAERIRGLLHFVHYLGDARGRGHGKLLLHERPWTVEPCETWPGFPLVRDGLPLRPLPQDWPGLEDPPLGYRVTTYPYWRHAEAVLCAVPGR